MSKEQNIDDILKLLKDSVSVEQSFTVNEPTPKSDISNDNISEDVLKEQLKNQYLKENVGENIFESQMQGEYVIDSDFLDEVAKITDDIASFEEISENAIEAIPASVEENSEIADLPEETDKLEVSQVIETMDEEKCEATNDEQTAVLVDAVDTYNTLEELDGVVISSDAEADDTSKKIEGLEGLEDSDRTVEQIEDEIIFADDEISEDLPFENEELTLTKLELDEPETHETFLASMRKIGVDFSSEDSEKIPKEPEGAEFIDGIQEDEIIEDEELDLSTINLMMQFCEGDELKEKIGYSKVESFFKQEQVTQTENVSSPAFEGKEYIAAEQNETILASYKKNYRRSLLSMCGCILISLITLVFEMMPVFGVRLSGGLDYSAYPAVYALVGLQFAVFSAAICYKQLWKGMKRAFSLRPDRHSIVAIVLMITALYDLILVIILAFSYSEMPAMFNAAATITVALSAVADHALIACEMRAFQIYSADSNKYTLVCESGKGSAAEKMYSGGLEANKKVYSVCSVDFPTGFFRCTEEKEGRSKILTVATLPTVFIGIILSVVAILLGAEAYDAASVFMISIYAILPISIIFSDFVPYLIASKKLSKRGSAFVGRGSVDKYSDCDIMVFGDLHMFRKCKTEDVGIVIYDTSVSYLMLGCLKALYSKIGGPLSGMQMELPDVFTFERVDIRRMSRNGIEALIDKKHVLIVGEHDFLRRYGLLFPENEKDNERSTLCVSLNGKVTAKLSVKYETEPVFEMIVERLYTEGISCAVHTYDPLINSALVASVRTLGDAPISVVHKNTEDFYLSEGKQYFREPDGVISCASRLKLAEVEVWFKRLKKIGKISQGAAIAFSCVGIALVTALVSLDTVGFINEFHLLLFLLLELGSVACVMLSKLPSKKYFTTERLYFELEKEHEKLIRQQDKAAQKQENKKNISKESNSDEQAD